MKAEILTIGDEILIGQITNTNSSWMAKQLNLSGVQVCFMSTVADDEDAIREALKLAGRRAQLVLMTGGLGPTRDDVTKKTIAAYFGMKLVLNQQVLEDVTGFFSRRNRPLTEVNRQQALIPEGCIVIRNFNGTAPGMWIEKNGVVYVSMPGVPFEMTGMMERDVLPLIRKKFALPSIHHITILTQGIGESMLAEIIEKWEDSLANEKLKLAYLPQPGLVRLRVSGSGTDRAVLRQKMEGKVNDLLPLIKKFYVGRENFGDDPITPEKHVAKLLVERGQTVSLAESCTGGHLSSLLTAIPGASEYYRGGVVPYANVMKHKVLDVDPEIFTTVGAVSRECVEQLATNVRNKFESDYSVAISGIAGPTGATDEKPVGTVWIAVSSKDKLFAKKYHFGGDRRRNIDMSSNAALQLLGKLITDPSSLEDHP